MELILLRHGQAEEFNTHAEDVERALTAKGSERIRRVTDGLKFMVREFSIIKIWSSPLLRARQTADIVADALNVKCVEEIAAVATGDIGIFKGKIAQLPGGACLIVVGHQPYLSLWSEEICGVALPFSKGAAAAVKVDDSHALTGKLRWFADPEVLSDFARA